MEGEEETVIPLQHGDKIAIEVLPDLSQEAQAGASTAGRFVRVLAGLSYEECWGITIVKHQTSALLKFLCFCGELEKIFQNYH